jgi:hypothetical protein
MPLETIDKYFPILFGLAVLQVSGSIAASVLYRRARGKPIMSWDVPDAVFIERTASGHSNRTWLTKLGGAHRCLVVAVTGTRLIIRPRFPFNLMFLPEVYGLEHDIEPDRVTQAQLELGRGGSSAVRLEFRDPDDTPQDVTLYLRNPAEFVKALGKQPV